MAQKVKKQIFKILPWSVVGLMIIVLLIGVWQVIPVQNAKAAVLAPTSVTYRDLNNDGQVDVIRIAFTDVTACTYEAGDWNVSLSGTINVTAITGFANAGSCTTDEYIDVSVTANPGITGGAANPQIQYNDNGTAGSVVADGNQDGTATFNPTDAAKPIVSGVALLGVAGTVNRIQFSYSENVTLTGGDGASTPTKGDITTAGVIAGIGDFTTAGTAGNVSVPTTKNTVSGSGFATITIYLADLAGGYLNGTSTTEPSGVFTPTASAVLVDGNSNQVNTANTPTLTGGGSWDLVKPTISSVTISDAAGSNGKVDRAVVVFNSAVRDSSITNSNGLLAGAAGTFTTGAADDATTTFDRTADTGAVDTSATAAQFNYTGATTKITDIAGNLLDTAVDGTIADADIVETDGAAPVAISATYRDVDGPLVNDGLGPDGTVDRVWVTFSETIQGNTYTDGDWTIPTPGDINLPDESAAAFSGPNVLLTVFTGDPGETGGVVNPTVQYVNNNNDISDSVPNNVASFGPLTVTDAAAPIPVSLVAQDTDVDGTLDRIVVTFTEPLANTAAGANGFDITSAADHGSCTGESADPDGTNVLNVDFSCTTVNTSVGDLTLNFTTNAGVKDAANNQVPSGVLTGVSTPAITDGAAPIILSGVYADSNANGRVDQIVFTTTPDVGIVCSSFFPGPDYTINVAGTVNLAKAGGDNCVTNGTSTITINLVAGFGMLANTTGGVTAPDVSYNQPGNGIEDGAGNDVPSSGAIVLSDAATPLILSGVYTDSDADGAVDRAILTTTADTGIACSSFTGATDFTVPLMGTVGLSSSLGDSCSSNGTSTITFDMASPGNANMTGGVTNPQISYVQPGNGVEDGAGNDVPTALTVTLTDAAAPLILSGVYIDSDSNGDVDRVVFTTTAETGIACSAFTGSTDFTVGTAGTVGLNDAAGDSCSSNGTSNLIINLANPGTSGVTGGVVDPIVTYTQPGNGVEDGAGNDLPTTAGVTLTDAAAPVVLAAVYTDSDADGAVDQAVLTTSADTGIACTAFTGGVDFVISAAGTVNLAEAGGDTCSTNGTSTVTIDLATPGNANTTGGAAAPAFNYTQPGNGIEDGMGNDLPTVAGFSLTDAAAPLILSGRYNDSNSDGAVDRAIFTTTDDTGITCTAFTGGVDFTVGTAGTVGLIENAGDACSSNGTAAIIIDLATLGNANITGGITDPVATYTQPGNGVEDGAGNDVPTAAGVTLTDAANPLILSGVYADGNADGQVDQAIFTTTVDIGIACTAFTGGADFTVGTTGTVGLTPAGGDTCSSNGTSTMTIDLVSAPTANTTGGGTDPIVTYTQPGNGVEDGVGNDLLTAVGVTLTDGAGPVILFGVYTDSNSDGAVDQSILTTTTDTGIACTAFAGGVDFTFSAAGTIGLAEAGGDACSSNGTSTVTIDLATPGNANMTGGATDPMITYTQPGNGIEDGVGNDIPTAAGVGLNDVAAPLILSGVYTDSNSDGAVDQAIFTTTADTGIACTAFTSGADFTVGTAGTVGLAEAGGDACSSNGSSTVIIDLATPGNANMTGGVVDPVVTYAQPGNGVEDGWGNDIPTAAGVTLTDGAAPVIVTTSPASAAVGVGTTATVVVTFSEPMSTGTVTKTSLPVSGAWVPVWSGGNSIATYSHTAFANSTPYTQQITAGNDTVGNTLAGSLVPNPWSFTTVAGGGGGSGGGGMPVDSTPPASTSIVIASGAAETSTQTVNLTLGATDVADMIISNLVDFSGSVWEAFSTAKTWTLTPDYGTKTVYAKFRDSVGNTSASVSDTINYVAVVTTPPPATPLAAQLPGQVSSVDPKTGLTTSYFDPTSKAAFMLAKGVAENKSCEDTYRPLLSTDAKAFGVVSSSAQLEEAVTFVCYGITTATENLGSGERRAMMRDYWNTAGYADVFWDDVARNAVGQKYVHRNLQIEQAQVPTALRVFRKIFGHDPNFKVLKEDLTWNTIMYRLRFVRDLNLERAGIVKFRSLFLHTPSTPLDWAVVRALGYIQ